MLWVERNICEHDKLVFRGIMVKIEITNHTHTKRYLYVTSICNKSVAHSTRFYHLYWRLRASALIVTLHYTLIQEKLCTA